MNRAQMLLLDILYPNRCDCCDNRIPYDQLLCEACINLLLQQRVAYADWEQQHPENPWLEGTVLFPYEDTARTGVLEMKNGRRGFCVFSAKLLAELLAETNGISLVTWVPVTARRRRRQGYAHAEYLARCIAKELALPVRGDLLKEHAGTIRQHDLPAAERQKYAERFSGTDADLSDQHILLVDDILTTGATLRRCASLLLEMGAARVDIAAVCAGIHTDKTEKAP